MLARLCSAHPAQPGLLLPVQSLLFLYTQHPLDILLVPDSITPTGLTPTRKLKREIVTAAFRDQLSALYATCPAARGSDLATQTAPTAAAATPTPTPVAITPAGATFATTSAVFAAPACSTPITVTPTATAHPTAVKASSATATSAMPQSPAPEKACGSVFERVLAVWRVVLGDEVRSYWAIRGGAHVGLIPV